MKFNFTEETTLAEYLDYWFVEFGCRSINENTLDKYYDDIHNHILPAMGDIPLKDITLVEAQEFINELSEHGNLKTGGKLSVKSCINIRNLLSKAMEKAVDLELISKNPVRSVVVGITVKKTIGVLTPEEERLLLQAVLRDDYVEYGFAIWLGLKFGLRSGEICALKWSDFDFRDRSVSISRSVHRRKSSSPERKTYIAVGSPKTVNSNRTIPFTDATATVIMKEMDRRRRGDYYEKNRADNYMRDFVFVSRAGGYADACTLNKKFKRILKEQGIEGDYHFHCLRHTFATRGIEKGVDVKTLSEILGHSSVQFTLDRYAHVLSAQKRKVMEIMLSDE